MPRKNPQQVLVDPVAAAKQLETKSPDPLDASSGAASDSSRSCALGHPNAGEVRFCGQCGLPMDAPAPAVRVSLEDARPKPAGELSPEERAERDKQHAEALAAARAFEAQQPVYTKTEGEAVLIHFVEDGFTFAGQVWYRGQEIEIGPGHPRWEQVLGWITLDKYAQIERYGKQFFEHGPWPGRRSYTEGADGYQRLYAGRDKDNKLVNPFAGPGADALRAADEAERRRGRAVPAPLG